MAGHRLVSGNIGKAIWTARNASMLALASAIASPALAGVSDPTAEFIEGQTSAGETTSRNCLSNGFIEVVFTDSSGAVVSRIESSTTCTGGGTPRPTPGSDAALIQNYSSFGDRAAAAFVATDSVGTNAVNDLFDFLELGDAGDAVDPLAPLQTPKAKPPCDAKRHSDLIRQLAEAEALLDSGFEGLDGGTEEGLAAVRNRDDLEAALDEFERSCPSGFNGIAKQLGDDLQRCLAELRVLTNARTVFGRGFIPDTSDEAIEDRQGDIDELLATEYWDTEEDLADAERALAGAEALVRDHEQKSAECERIRQQLSQFGSTGASNFNGNDGLLSGHGGVQVQPAAAFAFSKGRSPASAKPALNPVSFGKAGLVQTLPFAADGIASDGVGGSVSVGQAGAAMPWRLYLRTALEGLDDDRAGADIATEIFTVNFGGAVKVSPDTALSGEVFYRTGEATSNALFSEIEGEYYGGTFTLAHKLSDNVKFGASASYIRGDNDLNVNGGANNIASFDVEAFRANAVLRAEVPLGALTLQPYVAGNFNRIDRSGFTDITGLIVPANDFSSGGITAGANITQKFINVDGFDLIKPRLGVFADYQTRDQAGALLANGNAFGDLGFGMKVSAALDMVFDGGVGLSIGGDYVHYQSDVKRFAGFARITVRFR